MNVVLRCTSCGTTQAATGECKTCHEAQVQYFCPNHDPGRWLSGPTCPQCIARLAPAPPAPLAARGPRAPVIAVSPRPEEPVAAERGWVMRLVLRLGIIAVVLVVGLLVALYYIVHALP